MHPLLKSSCASISHMSAIVVVAKEDCPDDEVFRSNYCVVCAKNVDPVFITLRAVLSAGAVTVFGNDDWLAGKCSVKHLQMFCQILDCAGSPGPEVFVGFDNVH